MWRAIPKNTTLQNVLGAWGVLAHTGGGRGHGAPRGVRDVDLEVQRGAVLREVAQRLLPVPGGVQGELIVVRVLPQEGEGAGLDVRQLEPGERRVEDPWEGAVPIVGCSFNPNGEKVRRDAASQI